jgi:protein cornichon
VLTLSDLECDYLNAQQCCSKLNIWSIPKITAHAVIVILLLFTGHWILFLVNIPFLGFLIYDLWRVPRGNLGIYDPAEIYVSELKPVFVVN